ncbi:MAG: type IV pilus modification protein PilV [Gammaproteobacteria bacterium]|nr:type IV pilus modification protein PilV [Gammaproteobacteria bacterium]
MLDKPTIRTAKHAAGATMIEILVTVVILAVGLLGIAALQLTSKKSSFESVQRTTASMLAQGILEKMRANAGNIGGKADTPATYNPAQPLNVYAGTLENPAAAISAATFTSEPAPNCGGTGTPCSPLQLATHDLWEFQQALIGATVTDSLTQTANIGGLVSPIACIDSFVTEATTVGIPPKPTRAGRYRITIAWRGQTEISDPDPNNPCGQASGNYDGDTAGDNDHRRLIVVDTMIAQSDH